MQLKGWKDQELPARAESEGMMGEGADSRWNAATARSSHAGWHIQPTGKADLSALTNTSQRLGGQGLVNPKSKNHVGKTASDKRTAGGGMNDATTNSKVQCKTFSSFNSDGSCQL